MKYTIVGSGFGLYGYLPSLLVDSGATIFLPIKYQKEVVRRKELKSSLGVINWLQSEVECINHADVVIVASMPLIQNSLILSLTKEFKNKILILEKPLGQSPSDSLSILDRLKFFEFKFRINYSFIYCKWYPVLEEYLKVGTSLQLNWQFKAHHFKNNLQNWKRIHEQGGGVLRFYGIHVIAMLSQLGYTRVTDSFILPNSMGDLIEWNATFIGANVPEFKVNISSDNDTQVFNVLKIDSNLPNSFLIKINNPFELEVAMKGQDVRSSVIVKLIKSLSESDLSYNDWYCTTNSLWELVEKNTKVISRP